jgi:hypothetical protein
MQDEASAPPLPAEPPAIALRREHLPTFEARLSDTERAALVARLDSAPTKTDWEIWKRDIDARIDPKRQGAPLNRTIGGRGIGASHSGRSCCSIYRFRTSRGAPPAEITQ